ncbi:hypothetical protein Chor_014671 [Crotalus horridus]
MAAAAAARLARQEREVRGLAAEVVRLKEASAWASPERPGPELRALREENEKLRYRLHHLRRSLAAEQGRQDLLEAKTEEKEQKTELQAAEGGPKEDPTFIWSRLELYKELKKESDALLQSRASGQSQTIQITLSDGKVMGGQAWKTTPYQVAVDLSWGVADSVVIARVNGELWDLDRPMEGDSTLELLTFENEDAQAVYWHSSAHILGEAMENYYGGCLCYGPPIENGFYYDMHMENRGVSSTELLTLENICKSIIKEKQPFERLEVRKEDLLEMFKNSSTYWEGKSNMETLQRIYGISFPEAKMMKEWEKFQEEAKKRDHRKIGKVGLDFEG